MRVPTEDKEALLTMMKPLAGGKAATTCEKNHKAEGVPGTAGRTTATSVKGSPWDMTMVTVSGDEAENRAKYHHRMRMVAAAKERELQLNPVAARIGIHVTTSITGKVHTRAATLSRETAGAMVTGITPREGRAEITATRSPVALDYANVSYS